MTTTAIPAGYRLARKWSDVTARQWACTIRHCPNGALWGVQTEDCDGENDQDEGQGACADHAVEAGALIKVSGEPERCACEESLALRAQLREAAAHIGDLLAIAPAPRREPEEHAKRDAARAWLTGYLAKQPAR